MREMLGEQMSTLRLLTDTDLVSLNLGWIQGSGEDGTRQLNRSFIFLYFAFVMSCLASGMCSYELMLWVGWAKINAKIFACRKRDTLFS
jgi:hypothetical protein